MYGLVTDVAVVGQIRQLTLTNSFLFILLREYGHVSYYTFSKKSYSGNYWTNVDSMKKSTYLVTNIFEEQQWSDK